MGKVESLFINFALAGLLILSILLFTLTLQQDNNATDLLTDNTLMNESIGDLQGDLGGMRDKAQAQRELFEEEKPTSGFGSLILFSIVSSGKVVTGMTFGIFNVLIKLPMILFGVDPIIASVISTILIISFIFGLWVLYKLGG